MPEFKKVKTLEDHIQKYFCKEMNELNKNEFVRISMSPGLTEGFIRKYKDELNWTYITCKQELSVEFIEEHSDYVDWNVLNYGRFFEEGFIMKYEDKINWFNLAFEQPLSLDFIEKHSDKVNWKAVSGHQALNIDFITRNIDKLDLGMVAENNPWLSDETRNFALDLYNVKKCFSSEV